MAVAAVPPGHAGHDVQRPGDREPVGLDAPEQVAARFVLPVGLPQPAQPLLGRHRTRFGQPHGPVVVVQPIPDAGLLYAEAYNRPMQTSIRVTTANRDALARIAEHELGGTSLDEALRVVLFEHQTRVALARLADNPAMADDYLSEATGLAEVDVAVTG